ncbi:MAG: HAD-IA family hydrolase [Acidobacteriota bacterium]|nr:HAD-IA family hydrolase [Acidobacteriota bacterium]
MTSDLRYSTILLDVGETLITADPPFGVVYSRVLAAHGVTAEADQLRRVIQELWTAIPQDLPPGTDRFRVFGGGEEEFWRRFVQQVVTRIAGRPLADEKANQALTEIREAFLDRRAWSVFDDVIPTLAALDEQGVRLGVVSNWDSNLPRILDALDLHDPFETVVVSHLEGIEKPSPELFMVALDRLGVRPNEVLHIGDMPDLDAGGASAAGIDAMVVNRRGRLDETTPGVLPDLWRLPQIARSGAPIYESR